MQAITSAQLAPDSAGFLLHFLFDPEDWAICSSEKYSITTQASQSLMAGTSIPTAQDEFL
jgi:hypothetical protein